MLSNVGKKVSNYRKTHDVTIKELADQSGLSTSLISQLERGIGNPTISALEALAHTMAITLSDLFSDRISNEDLICYEKDRSIVRQEPGLTMENVLVEFAANTNLSVQILKLEPQAKFGNFEIHLEEECLCVLSGQIVVVFENEEFCLNAGDSIRVLPNRRHMVRNDLDILSTAMNIKCKVQY